MFGRIRRYPSTLNKQTDHLLNALEQLFLEHPFPRVLRDLLTNNIPAVGWVKPFRHTRKALA